MTQFRFCRTRLVPAPCPHHAAWKSADLSARLDGFPPLLVREPEGANATDGKSNHRDNASIVNAATGNSARATLFVVARIWKEKLTALGTANLAPREVILVRVASFTFRFTTKTQLRECIEYYERKTHPSSRISARIIASDIGPDWQELRSWQVERWFERLPMYLLEEPKRQKVLKALRKTLALMEEGKL